MKTHVIEVSGDLGFSDENPFPKYHHHQGCSLSFNTALLPLARLLRVIGFFPFRIRTFQCPFDGTLFVSYDFSWRSIPTLYSIGILFLVIVTSHQSFAFNKELYFLEHYQFRISGTEQGQLPPVRSWSFMTKFCHSGFALVYSLGFLLSLLAHWTSIRYLQEFLDSWSVVNESYKNGFQRDFDYSRVRHTVMSGFVVNLCICGVTFPRGLLIFWKCWVGFDLYCKPDGTEFALVSWILLSYGLFSNFFVDTKVIVMLQGVGVALHQFNQQLIIMNDEYLRSGRLVTRHKVKYLKRVLFGLRRQAELAKLAVGRTHALWIFIVFTLTVLTSFSLYDLIVLKSDLSNTVFTKTFMCYFGVARTLIKSIYAERTVKEERNITKSLLQLECAPLRTQIEKNIVIDHLTCRPIKFMLADVVNFNTALALILLGNITTYLVVLLQFNELTRPKST